MALQEVTLGSTQNRSYCCQTSHTVSKAVKLCNGLPVANVNCEVLALCLMPYGKYLENCLSHTMSYILHWFVPRDTGECLNHGRYTQLLQSTLWPNVLKLNTSTWFEPNHYTHKIMSWFLKIEDGWLKMDWFGDFSLNAAELTLDHTSTGGFRGKLLSCSSW